MYIYKYTYRGLYRQSRSLNFGSGARGYSVSQFTLRYYMSGMSCLRLSCCIYALNCCVKLCLTGWVYMYYVGHIDKIMKRFSMLQS
jgi:hypothetical protein